MLNLYYFSPNRTLVLNRYKLQCIFFYLHIYTTISFTKSKLIDSPSYTKELMDSLSYQPFFFSLISSNLNKFVLGLEILQIAESLPNQNDCCYIWQNNANKSAIIKQRLLFLSRSHHSRY